MESSGFPDLAGQRYLCLITFRHDGRPARKPVWFAEVGGRLYVRAASTSDMVRHIRRNPAVQVVACTVHGAACGPTYEGAARLVETRPSRSRRQPTRLWRPGTARPRPENRRVAGAGYPSVLVEIAPASPETDLAAGGPARE
jgi:PPOX class probable F420-dependent enzyme